MRKDKGKKCPVSAVHGFLIKDELEDGKQNYGNTFDFMKFCQKSSEILNELFLDMRKVKSKFIFIFFTGKFVTKAFRGRTTN